MTDSLWNYRFDIRETDDGRLEILPMGTGLPKGWLASVRPDGCQISERGKEQGLTEANLRLMIAAAMSEPGEE